MGYILHRNTWHWGQKDTIVVANGRGLCCVSVENGDATGAWLSDLIVHEPSRGCGIGRYLLQLAENHAREMGAKYLRLWTNPNDWPFEWYKRNKFVPLNHIEDGLIVMEKELA